MRIATSSCVVSECHKGSVRCKSFQPVPSVQCLCPHRHLHSTRARRSEKVSLDRTILASIGKEVRMPSSKIAQKKRSSHCRKTRIPSLIELEPTVFHPEGYLVCRLIGLDTMAQLCCSWHIFGYRHGDLDCSSKPAHIPCNPELQRTLPAKCQLQTVQIWVVQQRCSLLSFSTVSSHSRYLATPCSCFVFSDGG